MPPDAAGNPISAISKASCSFAMPGMSDDRFARSVIYLCAHSAEGAMGIVIKQARPGSAAHGNFWFSWKSSTAMMRSGCRPRSSACPC